MSPPGMMALLGVVIWSALPPLVLLSVPEHCAPREIHSAHSAPSELDSLQCHNDYESYVLCEWREGPHVDPPLQLWFQNSGSRKRCEPLAAAAPGADGDRTARCLYETQSFSIGISHTVFFDHNRTVCPPVPRKLHLSHHLKARPPVDLTARKAADGSWCVEWSAPYPASSSLSRNLTYQLSYGSDGQDNWTTEETSSPSVKLEKRLLLPGRRYEARVRCRAAVGQWSPWSAPVSWRTEEDAGHIPSVHCVLDGEKEVTCGWEVSRELDRFITYELACRHDHTAPFESCCASPTVSRAHGGTVLRYSCPLSAADPARLQLELLPARRAKTFGAGKHIRPNPPLQVKVRKRGQNWVVEWTEPRKASSLGLYYQVCYYRTQDEASAVLQDVLGSSLSYSILDASLTPSQQYRVKVRSLLLPGEGTTYEGTPSEWSNTTEWTSHAATWSLDTLIYIAISACVIAVFLTLYCTIPACQRKVVLWVDSVPSPEKSKTLSDLKSAANLTLTQCEDTSICTVQSLDSLSTCSSHSSLWPTKDSEEEDKACWDGDNPPGGVDEANDSGNASLRFSGPYIFCKSSEYPKSEEPQRKEEAPPPGTAPLPPATVNFARFGGGYVCLPSHSVSKSEQDLTASRSCDTGQREEGPEAGPGPDKTDAERDIGGHQPPSPPCTPWPAAKTSGYCFLPTAAY